jgi:hypothetical protein
MNSTAVMPMPMRLTGSVAPDALGSRDYSWLRATAPVSTGLGLGLGSSFVCITGDANQKNQDAEINTKAHADLRPQETST